MLQVEKYVFTIDISEGMEKRQGWSFQIECGGHTFSQNDSLSEGVDRPRSAEVRGPSTSRRRRIIHLQG